MMDSISARVLLAEDNKANQRVSKAMLEKIGAEVDIAEDGQQVLTLLAEKPYDLILMDCQMPVMDGFEATAAIRQLSDTPYHAIPIIALTADVQQDTREKCEKVGMNDFLSKPFTFDKLIATISRQLQAPRPAAD